MIVLVLASVLSASPTVVPLTVHPAAEPRPALKYQLLPEVRELKPGNPVQWYLRCFMEQRNFFFRKDVVETRAKQRMMPLKDLPAQELRHYGGSALTQADWGARLDTPDWEVLDRVQKDGPDLRLPELAPLRELARALQLRFRGEVARGDFNDAIRTAKTMFALARHLGESPASAANQLGLEVASLTLDTLTEMIQQPRCPNLYWALTDLPCPVVELRKGAQGDRVRADRELRTLRDDAAMTDAELEELVSHISGRAGFAREQVGLPPRNLRAELAARAKDADAVRAARQRLIAAGVGKETIAGFPTLQVVLLDEKRKFEGRRDDELKLLGLKLWEIEASVVQKDEANGLFADLLPHISEARRAQGRLEQRIALLRHVEALRMYAAAHAGKLPVKLADVGVPLPSDPFNGKAFTYTLDGTTARLSAVGLRYEVVLAK